MIDTPAQLPRKLLQIEEETKNLNFDMPSERLTGAILRSLAASKPDGTLLELGTGTGLSAAWILDGLGSNAQLTSIEVDSGVAAVAKKAFADDGRFHLVIEDGADWLSRADGSYDFIFADAMPGKYENFERAWDLLSLGGLYVCDDMLPQPNWPEGHEKRVEAFVDMLDNMNGAAVTKLSWATGICVVTRTA